MGGGRRVTISVHLTAPLTGYLSESTALRTSFYNTMERVTDFSGLIKRSTSFYSALIPAEGLTGWKNGPDHSLDHINMPGPSQVLKGLERKGLERQAQLNKYS